MSEENKVTVANNVVPMRLASKTTRKSDEKWGKQVMELGFCVVPSLLFRAQQRLGLNPTHLAVLVQLCDYWWESDRKPYPGKKAVSQRLGLSPRQVQRYIAELEGVGLVNRIERRADHGGRLTNAYDLSGLVNRLKELEPEFRAVQEEAKARRTMVGHTPVPATRAGSATGRGRKKLNPGRIPEGRGGPGAYKVMVTRQGGRVKSSSIEGDILSHLEASFSPERMSTYLRATGGDREKALHLYTWKHSAQRGVLRAVAGTGGGIAKRPAPAAHRALRCGVVRQPCGWTRHRWTRSDCRRETGG